MPAQGLRPEVRDRGQREPLETSILAHEAGHEVGRRMGQDFVRRPELGQPAALLHDRDQVAHLDRLVYVVSHEDDRLGQLALQPSSSS